MQIRNLGGCKRLLMAAAIASLIAAPLAAATGSPGKGLKPGSAPQAPQAQSPEDAPRVSSAILFPRSNYVWPFATGPVYGQVEAAKVSSPGVLHTRVGSFDLTRGMPNFPSELRKPNMLATLGSQYFLLQVDPESFRNGAFDEMKGLLTAQGGAIVLEMPVGGFVARMTPGAHGAIKGLPSIVALEPYQPALKISPEVGRIPLPDPIRAVSDVYALELQLFPGEDPARVAKSLNDLGIEVTRTFPDTIYVNADRSKLAAIAGIEAVEAINENLPIYPHSEETTSTVQTGRWNTGATPYNDQSIDGRCGNAACTSPQVLMVLDTGIQLDAGDLSEARAASGSIGASHRKVIFYGSTVPFGGSGDLLGCDNGPSGGFTHGHTVAVTALGNATKVPVGYGTGWQAPDTDGNPWDLDGLAPRAKLVAYDAGLTPLTGACDDPHNPAATPGIFPGDLYAAPSGGSLGQSYTTHGARIVNFSWGTESNTYTANSEDIDQFILDKGDAMVFISAGNAGVDTNVDGVMEPRTVGTPATAKNAIIVGASNNANDQFNVNNPESRPNFSSMGPAGGAVKYRTVPTLMAPGTDIGAMGVDSEYNCRSLDNDQADPVQCDIVQNLSGTSFASPAAAGAGILVRDYFAQGFYPDGISTNSGNASDRVGNISGMLTKAVLIASADYMDDFPGLEVVGGNLDYPHRFSNEQGYGRIQLTNALPLQTYAGAVTGLIVADGAIAGGVNSTSLNTNLAAGAFTSTAINVCDASQPISIGLAWADQIGNDLVRDLDLELLSPAGRKYIGNFYTDNENSNNGSVPRDTDVTDPGEGCDFTGQPWPLDSTGLVDDSAWSLPVQSCPNANADSSNPTEGIHLSPDPRRNGIVDNPETAVNEAADNQIETGIWTLTVKAAAGNSGAQNYALAVSGGVCLGSAVRIQKVAANNQLAGGTFVCNDSAVVTVNEVSATGDVNPSAGTISTRTTVEVWDAGADLAFNTADDFRTDFETGLTFTDLDGAGGGLRFDSNKLLLTDGTGADPGNGILDVRSGQQIRVIYQDVNTSGNADPNLRRINVGSVDCRTTIAAGGVVFGQFGKDAFTLVSGGCEKDARGYFTFGFPDRYMDKDELVGYLVAFQSAETGVELQDVEVSLRAVATDADSPVDCKPGAVTCADPTRANNPPSPHLTVLDSPKVIGSLPAGSTATPSFTIQVSSSITGIQQADMVLGVSAKTAGKGVESVAVQRETLNVDPVSFFYNTDFPLGGLDPVGGRDFNNNEILETVTNDPSSFIADYVFETRSYSNLTAGGFNTTAALRSPWNFDTNDGGFTSGIQNGSRPSSTVAIAQWGEDKNFNNRLDGFCSLATTSPCTQGLASETCDRCSNDPTLPCTGPADCGGNACTDFGTCTYTLDEDRDPAGNGILDRNWGTRGGCGWQTRGAIATGGIWHTGRIDVTTVGTCLAAGTTSARCQFYERHPIGDAAGDIYWWEMLLTPVINKVNQCPGPPAPANPACLGRVDQTGDPVYQVAIDDWAWNMSIELADNNTAILSEFDTDIDKLEGADFYNDFALTNIVLFGVQGAVSGGNAPIMDGFNMFAPVSKCVDTDDNGTLDHCTRSNGVACTADTVCTGNDINGIVGGSRHGDNNCFFEGKTAGVVKSKEPWGLATPRDDDQANGYCLRSDALSTFDKSIDCVNDNACTLAGAPYTTCSKPNTVADEYVQANGPGRNYGMRVPNGPDMRFSTLEDFYGDSGTRFQAALSIYNREPVSSTITPNVNGYGMGIDDMFISWQEYRLDEDVTNCAGSGECADLEIQSTLNYDSASILTITVTDKTPYDAVNNKNDCNGNGSYADAVDDQDCNNNGALDVTVKLTSLNEVAGEIAFLDQVSPGSPVYKGNFPYSSTYDSPGTLFLQVSGTSNPVVLAQYEDRNDGTGSRCKNALEPEQQGFLRANCTVILTGGRLNFKTYALVLAPGSPGDDDGFADAGETVDFTVTLINKSGVDLDDIVATVSTLDTDKIQCITKPVVFVGSALNNATFTTPAFRFKVAESVNRTDVNQLLQATFNLTVRSNRFDVLSRPISISTNLDLNATGSGTTSPFIEDFEGSGLGLFTLQSIDADKTSLALSDGYRCQYNDPFGPNTNSPDRADCFLGFPSDPAGGINDWHIQAANPANCNSGRAYTGLQSLRWGTCPPTATTPVRDTTRFKQIDAVRTINPIYLPLANGAPELTWKHQASLVDNRNIVNVDPGENLDRGVVQIQLADGAGNPVGDWVNLDAYENAYDQQGTDDFTNCMFDPIDDGNDEDDFFDPGDPLRRLGPSSTCYPEFAYSRSGHTDWRLDFNAANIGLAGDGPGLQGNPAAGFRNPGTWVQPKVNLLDYAGRSVRIRFLATSVELGSSILWDELFAVDNVVGDDGWFIDDVRINTALSAPLTISVDTASFTGLGCGACSLITPIVTATPSGTLSGPGQIVTLNAEDSTIDVCNNGVPQYQFWIDTNGNSIVGDAGDTLLRDWTDNSQFIDAPGAPTTYGVKVRCSTAPTCDSGPGDNPSNATTKFVNVACPASGNAKFAFAQSLSVNKAGLLGAEPDASVTVSWQNPAGHDLVRGSLNAVRTAVGNYSGTDTCQVNNGAGNTSADATLPASGSVLYFIARPTGPVQFCNQANGYTTNDPKELKPAQPTAIGRDASLGGLTSCAP